MTLTKDLTANMSCGTWTITASRNKIEFITVITVLMERKDSRPNLQSKKRNWILLTMVVILKTDP